MQLLTELSPQDLAASNMIPTQQSINQMRQLFVAIL
jgi:hypothetical protein